GAETYAADLLRLCGAVNVALRLPNRSPRVSLERFMSFNPQVILLARDPYPFEEGDLTAFWRFGDVEAIKQRQVHIVDGHLLTRFATRTATALDTLGGMLAL
ncbi:MAG TPA: helical backbone metal receptor, partial [Roseiflexaceae bacterium]|nr:helical backbone metal receptor [Roseiflexaceae bacterium]